MAKASWGVPSPWDVWLLALALMLLHDAWFFWTHTFLHRHKAAYRALHAQHHRYTNELGPFATSDAGASQLHASLRNGTAAKCGASSRLSCSIIFMLPSSVTHAPLPCSFSHALDSLCL